MAWAVANCHLMRDRFTVVDLLDLLGNWTEQDRATVTAAAASAVPSSAAPAAVPHAKEDGHG